MDFDPAELPPEVFRKRVRELEDLADEQSAALRKTQAQLDWWRQGLELFSGADPESASDEATDDRSASVHGTAPRGDAGERPPLRQGILRVLLDTPPSAHGKENQWRAAEVVQALDERGWMPAGNYAENSVRNMLRDLAKRGQVVKPRYGTYALAKGVREAVRSQGSGP